MNSRYEKRAERSERLEIKYAAMADHEAQERRKSGKPVTEAHRHLLELKYQGLALRDVACEGLKEADRYGEAARVCMGCGDVYHKDNGSLLDNTFCSDDCYLDH